MKHFFLTHSVKKPYNFLTNVEYNQLVSCDLYFMKGKLSYAILFQLLSHIPIKTRTFIPTHMRRVTCLLKMHRILLYVVLLSSSFNNVDASYGISFILRSRTSVINYLDTITNIYANKFQLIVTSNWRNPNHLTV